MMWVMGCGHQHLQTATGFHPRHEVCQGLKHCKHIVMTGFYNCQTTAELQKVRGGSFRTGYYANVVQKFPRDFFRAEIFSHYLVSQLRSISKRSQTAINFSNFSRSTEVVMS